MLLSRGVSKAFQSSNAVRTPSHPDPGCHWEKVSSLAVNVANIHTSYTSLNRGMTELTGR